MFLLRSSYPYVARLSNVAQVLSLELSDAINWAYTVCIKGNNSLGSDDSKETRFKKSNEMQQYSDIYLLLNYSTCFFRPSRPSSGVHKTVVATRGFNYNSMHYCCI